jgi:predicted DCC family thiol-disulfide oxidoreductase YuxK
VTGKKVASAGDSPALRLGRRPAYSYRTDAEVPAFPDDKPLVVFDGVCVLCTGFARFVLRHDTARQFRLATAQSPLGQALFRHYGLSTDEFESNLVIADGRAYVKLDTVALVGEKLGGIWHVFSILRLLPRPVADWLYDRIARNRYALFGRTQRCMMPPPEWRDRFIG